MFYNSDLYTNFTQAVNLSRGVVILAIFVKVSIKYFRFNQNILKNYLFISIIKNVNDIISQLKGSVLV